MDVYDESWSLSIILNALSWVDSSLFIKVELAKFQTRGQLVIEI